MMQRKQENPELLSAAVVAATALRGVSRAQRVPAAQLHVLLTVHVLLQTNAFRTAADLGRLQLMSLPLLRQYVRALEERGLLRREKFFRKGPRTLALTFEGKDLAKRCARAVEQATTAFASGA